MRLISLTSCVCQVVEHACLDRVNDFLELHSIHNSHIIGFRRGLSTQDAMIQLKEQVVDATGVGLRVILGLDQKSAFYTVKHTAILGKINELRLGARGYCETGRLVKGLALQDRQKTVATEALAIAEAARALSSPNVFFLRK